MSVVDLISGAANEEKDSRVGQADPSSLPFLSLHQVRGQYYGLAAAIGKIGAFVSELRSQQRLGDQLISISAFP